ncbi:MAG: CBS domain-containing protein [Myxococcaceae bacterium]
MMLRRVPGCFEGETAERAAVLMQEHGVDVVPVMNDNDSVTGLVVGHELLQVLKRPGPSSVRLRDVMRRLNFVVLSLTDGLDAITAQLLQMPVRYAVVVDGAGQCVGVLDSVALIERPLARS